MALVAPTVTGWSTFWNLQAPAGQGGNYAPRFFRSSEEYRAAVQLNKRGFRKYRAQIQALIGVAPGALSVDTQPRVTAIQAMNDGQSNGGKRTIGTVNNATTTTAGMVTAINARIINMGPTQAYATDRSGNGGGGKVGR